VPWHFRQSPEKAPEYGVIASVIALREGLIPYFQNPPDGRLTMVMFYRCRIVGYGKAGGAANKNTINKQA